MKTIQLTDEMYNFLMELSKELNTQDNRSTASPYFYQVKSEEEISVPQGCGIECWHSDGSKIETEEEIDQIIFDYKDEHISLEEIKKMPEYEKDEILKKAGWQKANYDYQAVYKNAFLTEKACRAHIATNKHHYENNPVDYVSYAFRNPELETLLKFLRELQTAMVEKDGRPPWLTDDVCQFAKESDNLRETVHILKDHANALGYSVEYSCALKLYIKYCI